MFFNVCILDLMQPFMCFAGQWWGLRLAVFSDSASPRNLELMLLGWTGRLTPRAWWYARLHPQCVVPPRHRAATMVAVDVLPWLPSPVVRTSGSLLLCLCCTLWCVVSLIHAFPFPKNCPLVVTASYGLVLCMIKFFFGRITPLFSFLLVVTAHIRWL
jgi:hypothetical protein